jgi:phosphatidylglycerol:prolipoprotein diacylglycerol transferase
LYPRLFQFGHIAIPTYGAFAALAIIAALFMASYAARRLSLDPNKIWNLSITGIFTALLGARLLLILFHLSDFLTHPFWMLGLLSIRSRGAFYGGLLLAICACTGYIFANRLPLRRSLDCLAPGAALGLAIHSLGAFAAGSDYGTPTTAPWGVVYMHGLARLWSGTPLGVHLHPVQLYEAAILFLLFGLLFFWMPRHAMEGELTSVFLFVYGATLYFLDFFHGKRSFIFADTISTAQLLAIVLVATGAVLWTKVFPPQTKSPADKLVCGRSIQ